MRVLIRNAMAPGDILMLTAAVRDLKNSHPEIHIGVETSAMAFWLNNPYIDLDVTADNADRIVYADYPLYKENNRLPYHFIHGFRMFLEDALQLNIEQGEFKVDIHLTDEEKDRKWIDGIVGTDEEYWLINAGSKDDFTIKQWSMPGYQSVVDDTKDYIKWVQIGSARSNQPMLKDVVDLVGKTDLRRLCQLMYHASGVLTPVSMPMHLATMDMPGGMKRPCVVIAGGREPSTWEAYPTHQFIHNCGCYPCNRKGGCWLSRVSKLHDGNAKHDNLICKWPVAKPNGQILAKCMDDISPRDVRCAIDRYFLHMW